MCALTHTHTHTHTHTQTHAQSHTEIHTAIDTNTYTHTHMTYIDTHSQSQYTHTHICTGLQTHVHTHTHRNTHKETHTHKHTKLPHQCRNLQWHWAHHRTECHVLPWQTLCRPLCLLESQPLWQMSRHHLSYHPETDMLPSDYRFISPQASKVNPNFFFFSFFLSQLLLLERCLHLWQRSHCTSHDPTSGWLVCLLAA